MMFSGGPRAPEESGGSLRDRLARTRASIAGTLTALGRVLQLVWEGSPKLTLGLGAATLLAGILPAAQAYTGKLLINSVVLGIEVHRGHGADVQSLPFEIQVSTVGAIFVLAAAQFLLLAVTSGLGALRNVTQQLLQERVSMKIQVLIMERASDLDLPFFEDSKSYDLLRQAQQGSANRPVAMISSAFGLIQSVITFVSMVALLVAISPLLALIALVSPVPAFISDTRYGWRGFAMQRWASPMLRLMTYLTSLVTTDSFAKEVKLYGLGGYFTERYRRLSQGYYDEQRKLVTSRYLYGYLWGALTTLAGSATYLYVALQAITDRLTLGDLTLYTQAAIAVQNSIQSILGGFSGMYEHNLYLSNLFLLLDTRGTIHSPAEPVPVPSPLRGEIRFEKVSFSYPGAAEEALHEVSFTIAPGETIAIVGRNGAGKTTLVKLICRLYDPSAGRILLDGVDLRAYDLSELRQQMAAMFQDYVTYQSTAAENIGLGSLPELENREAVQSAARKGGAEALVEGLPNGYDTTLGKWFEGGVNLSGGEWQKLALSRAFMREARILLLDEPTSALDAQAEYELFERLRDLASGRTAVYISHRFSTVRRADRILFLENGTIVEDGTHEELMALGGRYARLFRMQASAYTGEDVEEFTPPAVESTLG